jgi:hypothetical protein
LDTVDGETHVEEDGAGVFSAVDEVGEDVSGVVVTADTLEGSPDSWESREEAEEAGVGGVAG